ncbi:hypothetical protein [Kitasatospora sp. NBC_00458]|uniref:hypothetical protein n=1 Tax=Kitasatospora sp. NBC_00458 TaxID=2903568 RepID=UPI002E17910A
MRGAVRMDDIPAARLRVYFVLALVITGSQFSVALFSDVEGGGALNIMFTVTFILYVALAIRLATALARRRMVSEEEALRQGMRTMDIEHAVQLASLQAAAQDEIAKAAARAFAEGYLAGRSGSWLIELDRELDSLDSPDSEFP